MRKEVGTMNIGLIAFTLHPQRLIERCARISYQSKNEPYDWEVNSKFIRKLISMGHESPLEHVSATFLIDGISRACSHQIVRHRLASFSQKSQRYTEFDGVAGDHMRDYLRCKYGDRLDNRMQDICSGLLTAYKDLVSSGVAKEDARLILPECSATSLYMTANFREWRHFLKLRLDKHAQWEIQMVAQRVLSILHNIAPDCFHDIVCGFLGIGEDTLFSGVRGKLIEYIEGSNETSGVSQQ